MDCCRNSAEGCLGLPGKRGIELSCVAAAAPSTSDGHQAEMKMGVSGQCQARTTESQLHPSALSARPAVSLADPTRAHIASQSEVQTNYTAMVVTPIAYYPGD